MATATLLTADVHKLVGFSNEQLRVMSTQVIPKLEEVWNSSEFARKMVYHSYDDRLSFKENKGMSNQEIFNLFKSGKDKYNDSPDHDIDIYLTLYFSASNTIGYTYPNTFKTWVNKRYFNRWLRTDDGQANIIGNITHEAMHNFGFDHSRYWNSTRRFTVPYAYGYAARDIAQKL
jgi:hypothetical protein